MIINRDYLQQLINAKHNGTHYEAKKGSALSKDEEKQLIEYCKANPTYQGNAAIVYMNGVASCFILIDGNACRSLILKAS